MGLKPIDTTSITIFNIFVIRQRKLLSDDWV